MRMYRIVSIFVEILAVWIPSGETDHLVEPDANQLILNLHVEVADYLRSAMLAWIIVA